MLVLIDIGQQIRSLQDGLGFHAANIDSFRFAFKDHVRNVIRDRVEFAGNVENEETSASWMVLDLGDQLSCLIQEDSKLRFPAFPVAFDLLDRK